MALVKTPENLSMERNSVHDEVSATYTIFQNAAGQQFLQIDTYGSASRQMPNKKTQTLQFGPEGVAQLREILQTRF